jgi:DNA-binding LytR/AlgR family response regulator
MRPLNCIIVEDEAPAVEVLENYMKHFDGIQLLASFTGVMDALSFMKQQRVDVIFLDIQLPLMTGREFLDILEEKPLIIVTSAYSEYAVEAFDREVFDYLLKPYSLSRFTKMVKRLEQFFQKEAEPEETDVLVKHGYQQSKVRLSQIEYMESQREYLIFHLRDGQQVVSRMTMKEGISLFPKHSILRIHRSFLVPLERIKSISPSSVSIGSKELPLGKSYRAIVMEKWKA